MNTETNYQSLMDGLNTAIVVVDGGLNILYLNPAAEDLLAISRAQVYATPITNYFFESESAISSLQDASRYHHPYTKRRASWRLHNGHILTVDYSVTQVPELNHLTIEIQPLDRLLRISREEALISAQETTRNLVRGMAHEIKNPLGGIRGAAQLLARELPDSSLEEYTQIIIDEADRLRNLVDKMLGPRQTLNRRPINIHEVLERVAKLITAESKGAVTFIRNYDPSIPEFPADTEMLIQAVLNIVRNAMQAILEAKIPQGTMALKTRVQRQFTMGREHYPLVCRLDIKDNGPGISPDLIENIFYPMISGRAEGTGLGLSISQNLIAQHHGLVECESRPGQTTFSIYLPLEQHHAEA